MDDSKIFMFPDCGTSKTSNDVTALTAGLHIIVFDKQNNKLQLIV